MEDFIKRGNIFSLPLFTLFFLNFHCSTAVNTTITPTKYITDSETVVSSAENFRLGFFSPGNSTNRYVGIWVNSIPRPTTVWVANRDNPLKGSSGVLKIAEDGNLVILDGRENVLWTSNVSNIPVNNSMAELLDSGNLVMRETNSNSNGRILWQSFDHPSNTILPGMKVGVNLKENTKLVITSWKDNESDPSTGSFTLEVDPINIPQVIIKDGRNNQRYWRTGPWNGNKFIGVPDMSNVYINGLDVDRDDQGETVYVNFPYTENSTLVRAWVLDSDGEYVQKGWDQKNKQWVDEFHSRVTECDIYGKCGSFGSCNPLDFPICSCLRGFEPRFKDEWSKGNWSGGCVRRAELQCDSKNKTSSSNDRGGQESDRFLKLQMMKVPDYVNWWYAEDVEVCEQKCLNNCSCIAYSYVSNIGCMWWTGDLIDIQKFSKSFAGVDLLIRVAHSELGEKKDVKIIIIITVLVGIVIISLSTYFYWRWMTKQKGRKKKKEMEISLFDMNDDYGEPSDQNILGENSELKMFDFEMLAIATNNFSGENKLGHGGFGSVYKGKLLDGQEIAAKRLSKSSGQGSEEFKNEVLVISKLQHRNLVRLLGCCIEGEEKILIYEYMPNKSLDSFLFDPKKQALLDWRKRSQIIEGISRGILYLHRDSRLRVIHRDLKASNVLLDEKLNPKISDFGMARIFGGDELQANTRRVVGTYYMSPEYAMHGRFSEKSDVFSFGVLLLEIVSGKRNTSFYQQDSSLSLLGYAWQLWNEKKMQMLIDPTLLSEPYFEEETFRCIQVGLLCVQEHSKDRPTMSTTLSMLTSEGTTLPNPKQPAFIDRESSSSSLEKTFSVNNVTVTSIGGR